MNKNNSCNRIVALCLGILTLLWTATVCADPSARVARLSYINGTVSFSPAGDDVWVQATRNRPLITGDHLWVDTGARAELQIGSATIHLNGSTNATLLNLDDSVAQLKLAQGSLNVSVLRLDPEDEFEIDTPNLAFSIREPGDYRIDVDANGRSTVVTVRSGRGEVYGEGSAYTIYAMHSYRFFGNDLRDYYRNAYLPPLDDFDLWANQRNRRGDNSMTARYVSREVIGYEDLDEYGSWRNDPGYGYVWMPSRVRANWVPYNDGRWMWVNPWGWTWVDDAPWGFTVSHYGRWAHIRGTWCWVPGPIAARPVYAPALVVFVGGSNVQLSLSMGSGRGVAWFPLGPREIYRPAYPVSRNYFTNINNSNTVVNNVNITNVTNVTNVTNITNVTNTTYVNRQVPGAIVAVPATTFGKSLHVARSRVEVSEEAIRTAPVSVAATVTPDHESLRGAIASGYKPPAIAIEREVVAKTAPPPKPTSFARQLPALATNPGKPLDEAELVTVKPATPVPVAPVRLVTRLRSRDGGDKRQIGPSRPPQTQSAPGSSYDDTGQTEPRRPFSHAAESNTTAPTITPAGIEKPVPASTLPSKVVPARPPADREIRQAPSSLTERPVRHQPPYMVRPAEPVSAPQTVIKSDRIPTDRPPVERENMQAPSPLTERPVRHQPPYMVRPSEPNTTPPTVIKPDRLPTDRPPVNHEIRQALPPQTGHPEHGTPVPN